MKIPKVLFLLGSAGSGKTTVSQRYLTDKIDILNVDNEYEKILKQSGIGTNIAEFDHDKLSIAARALASSHANLKKTIQDYIQEKRNFVYDGTGGSYKVIEKMVYDCINAGYLVAGMVCWASPYTCLERNFKRERSLKPSIVIRNWCDVNKNIPQFAKLFYPRYYLINTDNPIQVKERNYFDIDQALLDFPVKGSGKIYTEQEKKDKQNEFAQIKHNIKQLEIQSNELRFDNPYITKQYIEAHIQ